MPPANKVRMTREAATPARAATSSTVTTPSLPWVVLVANDGDDETARHAGERAQAMGFDHLLHGGAALGQVLEERQSFGRAGVAWVVETRGTPSLLRVHPLSRSRREWRPTVPVPFP